MKKQIRSFEIGDETLPQLRLSDGFYETGDDPVDLLFIFSKFLASDVPYLVSLSSETGVQCFFCYADELDMFNDIFAAECD
jgi:hypothetical protein